MITDVKIIGGGISRWGNTRFRYDLVKQLVKTGKYIGVYSQKAAELHGTVNYVDSNGDIHQVTAVYESYECLKNNYLFDDAEIVSWDLMKYHSGGLDHNTLDFFCYRSKVLARSTRSRVF